jgi:hypothetical protein
LEATTGWATSRGDVRSAARLAAAAETARGSLGIPAPPIDRRHFTRWTEEVRRQLAPAELEQLEREGTAFTIEQAAQHALDEVLRVGRVPD